MNSDYDALRALYRAAHAEEQPTQADRHAVRMGLLATAAALGVQAATTSTAAAAGASVASAKGVVQLLLGGKFLGGLMVGAAIGTAVSATAYVVDSPKAQLIRSAPTQAPKHAPRSPSVLAATPVSYGIVPSNQPPDDDQDREPNPDVPQPNQAAFELPARSPASEANPAGAIAERREMDERSLVGATALGQRATGVDSSAKQNARVNTHKPVAPVVGADRLLAETAALAKVQAALDRKQPAQAMALLEQQRKDFSTGQLAEERSAAYVLALCAAGRRLDAEQARARFLAAHPNSPLAKRVSKSCDAP